jgi:hypothetical protein
MRGTDSNRPAGLFYKIIESGSSVKSEIGLLETAKEDISPMVRCSFPIPSEFLQAILDALPKPVR